MTYPPHSRAHIPLDNGSIHPHTTYVPAPFGPKPLREALPDDLPAMPPLNFRHYVQKNYCPFHISVSWRRRKHESPFCFECSALREKEIESIKTAAIARWTAILQERAEQKRKQKSSRRWPTPKCEVCGSRKHSTKWHRFRQEQIARYYEKKKDSDGGGIKESGRYSVTTESGQFPAQVSPRKDDETEGKSVG